MSEIFLLGPNFVDQGSKIGWYDKPIVVNREMEPLKNGKTVKEVESINF